MKALLITTILITIVVATVMGSSSHSSKSGSASSRHGVIAKAGSVVATAANQARKYGDGILQFFAQGGGELGVAFTNAIEDGAKAFVKTVATTLGASKIGNNINGVIGNVGQGVKRGIAKVVNAGEFLGTKAAGDLDNAVNYFTNGVDGKHQKADDSYYAAFK